MLAGVDAHAFVDAVLEIRMFGVDFPTRFRLDQRQGIRPVAIDFVGAEKYERGLRGMLTQHFQ